MYDLFNKDDDLIGQTFINSLGDIAVVVAAPPAVNTYLDVWETYYATVYLHEGSWYADSKYEGEIRYGMEKYATEGFQLQIEGTV